MKGAYSKLEFLPLGNIRAKGFLREQLLRSKDGMGGHLDELEPNMIAYPFVKCITEEIWGPRKAGWGAEISGNYWAGLICLAYTLNDSELIKKAENWVDAVLKRQRPDGYLGTYTDKDNLFDDYNAWGTFCGMRALLFCHEATGRCDVLDAIHKCMLWFCSNWTGSRKTRYGGPTIIEAMVTCYILTGDEKLLDFAVEYTGFLRGDDMFLNSVDAFLDDRLVYNSNHAAGYGIVVRLPALLYSVTGKEEYLEASIKGINKLLKKGVLHTGGPVCNYEYIGPVSPTAETEFCAYTYFNTTYSHMSRITGSAVYGDHMERIAYNGAQGARKKDEKAIAYMSSPNQIFATAKSTKTGSEGMQLYAPCFPTACCPVNSVSVIPEFVRGMALTDSMKNIYINAYGPSEIIAGGIRIEQDTLYPFRDTVNFTVYTEKESRAEFTMNLKIPSWCNKWQVEVNGERISGVEEKGSNMYLPARRIWKNGDKVKIKFDIKPRITQLNDEDAGGKHPLVIEYGALLFSLPIPEKWQKVKGTNPTPLPEGWSWYEVKPDYKDDMSDIYEMMGKRKNIITWNVALDEDTDSEDIEVIETEERGYVWEKPPLKLALDGYKAPYSYPPYPQNTPEIYDKRIGVTGKVKLELVPYGTTALRITYFPKAVLD